MRRVIISIDYETEVTYDVDVDYAEYLLYTSKESYNATLNERLGEFLQDEDGTQVENAFKSKSPTDIIKKIVGDDATGVVMNCEHDYVVSKPKGNLFRIGCAISFDVIPGSHDLYLNETRLTDNAIRYFDELFYNFLNDWEHDVVFQEWEGVDCRTNSEHKCRMIDVKCEIKVD